MKRVKNTKDFERILKLIEEARTRAFSKVNEELVMLYYNVGKTVSEKVSAGNWGESTVDELAIYISATLPGLSGFNRRGLYRMKQFYETYSVNEFVEPLASVLESALKANIKTKTRSSKVSALPTQKELVSLHGQFVNTLLTPISWAKHLEIIISN